MSMRIEVETRTKRSFSFTDGSCGYIECGEDGEMQSVSFHQYSNSRGTLKQLANNIRKFADEVENGK